MAFRRQVANSAIWVGLSTVVVKLLSFVTITLVLARVLDPADFGLVAVAWLAINSFEFFREMGVASALIYRQEDSDGIDADVANIALILGSLIIYPIIFLLAPFIEQFFRDAAGITPVLRVLALVMIINALSQTPYTLMAKDLDFRNKAIPEIIGGILNSIIAITMALTGYGVWALVAGYLADAIARTSLVWFFTKWRPRLRFDRHIWREMVDYGRHIVGSRLLIFGITNIDDLLVGRMLGVTALGFYTLAYRLSNVPATHITGLINNVMFPAFSKIKDDKERVRRVFFDTMHAIGLVTIPLAVATFVLGPNFVHNYYQGKWDDAIPAMQILVIYGLVRSIAANMGNIYRASGNPQLLTYLALWRFITMAVLLIPAIRLGGIVGVAILSAVVAVIDFCIAAFLNKRVIGGSYSEYARRLGPISLISILSAVAAWLLLPAIPDTHRLLPFFVASIVMVLIYSLFSWMLDPIFRRIVISGMNRLGPTRRLAAHLGA